MRNSYVIMILLGASLAGCMDGTQEDFAAQEPKKTPVGSTSVATPSDGTPAADAGSIVGRVTDDELMPLPTATVRIPVLDVQLAVAEEGRFEFLDVPAGRHIVEAQAPGHESASKAVMLGAGSEIDVAFELASLVADEPFIDVIPHVTVIHQGAGTWSSLVPGTCSDDCRFDVPIEKRPDFVVGEVIGGHSVPNPRGWDGLDVVLWRNSATGSQLWSCSWTYNPNAECLRLPLWFAVNRTEMDAGPADEGPMYQLRFSYRCEPAWFCIEERYETWVSLFYGYEEEEVPPDYSARPGGDGETIS